MKKYFAAINPATGQIASVRSTDTRNYGAALAIRWDDNDDLGVASYHRDAALAASAAGQFRKRGAIEIAVWETVEISAKEDREFRAGVKGDRSIPATSDKAHGQVKPHAAPVETVDPVKVHKLTKAMVRDMVAYLESSDRDITCHDGMTSKGLRSRGLMTPGEGRTGRLTPEGHVVAQALRG